ncbi:hypothetical protein MJO28_010971 [Puccinia striiformis f. sp. tritici]|uniref:Uncharacterized protein n=1 Tax=Puccinia striiformis f. sp. tritici TaxID=168172 RepID=A0ACC0E7F2_9BASI|nr:hypothetical protein MJO28_010971 [Puccinia striiformis f. sp. tritici]
MLVSPTSSSSLEDSYSDDHSLGSSEYIQVSSSSSISHELLDHPFTNISTPNSQEEQQELLLTSTLDLKLNSLEQQQEQPDIDSDQSLTSLFSFPDPLSSIESSTHDYNSDWLERYENRSPTSDLANHHLSDHSSYISSPSLSNQLDLLLQSPPTSPLSSIITPGSEVSYRLEVYLTGHKLTNQQSFQLSNNLRRNFCQFEPTPVSSHQSAVLPRFRQAISRILSDSSSTTDPHDLMYQTSWLDITLNDLTSLSEYDQRSFLADNPAQSSALIIYSTLSPDYCFPSDWLNELSRTSNSYKLLPILIDENHSKFQLLIHGFRHLLPPKTSTDDRGRSPGDSLPTISPGILLQEHSLEKRLIGPDELASLPTPTVDKLHELLIPSSSTKPFLSDQNRSHPSSPTGSKFMAVLTGLVAILATTALVLNHNNSLALEHPRHQSSIQHPVIEERVDGLMGDGLRLMIMSKTAGTNSSTTTTFSTVDLESIEGPELVVGKQLFNGSHQVIDPDNTAPGITHDFKPDQLIPAVDIETTPNNKSFEQEPLKLPPTLKKNNKKYTKLIFESRSIQPIIQKSKTLYQNQLHKILALSDHHHLNHHRIPFHSGLLHSLSSHTDHQNLVIWSKKLPARLRKGLDHLHHHPKSCLKHVLCHNSPDC